MESYIIFFHDINSLNLQKLQDTAYQYNYTAHCQSVSKAFISNYNKEFDNNTIYNIAVINFGIKYSILDSLSDIGCKIHIVSGHEANLMDKYYRSKPDGIVLSNGPGDPSAISGGVYNRSGI